MTDPKDLHIGDDYEKRYGFHDKENYVFKSQKGLTRRTVEEISWYKKEPAWMLEARLKALEYFQKKPMPTWGNTELLNAIKFDDIYYYVRPTDRSEKSWDDVPADIKNTFEKLGIPQAERKFLAGVTAQYESEVVYHSLRADLTKQGVIFLDTDTALREQPDIFRKYFGKVVPYVDNKFAALNTAVWSGGSFIYVPPGKTVTIPLQAYFRINTKNMGQFERTLIIADEGSFVQYLEGCTAPVYSSDSLHSAVVEIVVMKDARVRYTTIQNWSKNVYNLVTKRALAHENATIEWVDGNVGSKFTMKYPGAYLAGKNAKLDILTVAYAGDGQHQDTGGKAIHAAPYTTSSIVSKSISKGSGRTSYRGLVKINHGAENCKSHVRCDALLLDPESRSDTYPYIDNAEYDVQLAHEATVSKVGEEQLFYLQSRGMSENDAMTMIVNGFIEQFTKELPLEYAVELNRLIQLEMTGAAG